MHFIHHWLETVGGLYPGNRKMQMQCKSPAIMMSSTTFSCNNTLGYYMVRRGYRIKIWPGLSVQPFNAFWKRMRQPKQQPLREACVSHEGGV